MPNITIGPLVVEALRPVTDKVLDCHLVSPGRTIATGQRWAASSAASARGTGTGTSIGQCPITLNCTCLGLLAQMIVEPEQRIPDFAKAGADIISVHAEQSSTTHLHRVVYQVRPSTLSARPVASMHACCSSTSMPSGYCIANWHGLPLVGYHSLPHLNPGRDPQLLVDTCRSRTWAARPVWC